MKTIDELRHKYKEDPVLLEVIARDYLGIANKEVAARRARDGSLGVRAYQLRDSRKAPWLVSLADLADTIDRKRARG